MTLLPFKAALLTNDRIISNNGKAFLKGTCTTSLVYGVIACLTVLRPRSLPELILRRDSRIAHLLKSFEGRGTADSSFLESLHELISKRTSSGCAALCDFVTAFVLLLTVLESQTLYNELFFDTSLEVGKTLSKSERDAKELTQEKVCSCNDNVRHLFWLNTLCFYSRSSTAKWSTTRSTECSARSTPHLG
jgi:hypothetical protein